MRLLAPSYLRNQMDSTPEWEKKNWIESQKANFWTKHQDAFEKEAI